jgi:TRAP-type transport system small permease protein
MLDKALRHVLTGVEMVNVALLLTVIVVVLGQVVARYVLNISATGSEEAARYLLIVIVMLGASTAVKNGSHMAVGYFASLHRPSIQLVMEIVCKVIILAVALLLLIKGFELSQRTMMQTSPALRISRGYIAAALPVGGFFIIAALLHSVLTRNSKHIGERP